MSNAYEYDDEEGALELAPWLSWPQCPICARRRQARCPTCGFADDDFPLADYQEFGADWRGASNGDLHFAEAEDVLLMCPQCEEAFRPRFYDRCAACGYEYGEGVRMDLALPDDFSPRVVWAVAAMFAIAITIYAWFWAILH
jgi:hypothetical protein